MTIYLVRRHDGTFMRYGRHWGDMEGAQVYTKPGPAKARVTCWMRSHPNEPVPTLLMFPFTEDDMHVVDLSESTSKAIVRIQRRKLEAHRLRARLEIERLKAEQAHIEQRLATLNTS